MLELVLLLMLGLFVVGLILAVKLVCALIVIPLKVGAAVLQIFFWLLIGIPLLIVGTVALALLAPAVIFLALGFFFLLLLCAPFLLFFHLIL
jgi:hypothetical protein